MGKHARDAVSAIKWNERLIRNLRTNPDPSWSSQDRVTEIFLAEKEIHDFARKIDSEVVAIFHLSNDRFTTTNSMTAV